MTAKGNQAMTIKPEYLERAVRSLAEAVNGGSWETHYTPDQRELWRARVLVAMRITSLGPNLIANPDFATDKDWS
jgi:hypothetical protein